MQQVDQLKKKRAEFEEREREVHAAMQRKLNALGNIVHESVHVDANEDNNPIVRTWGKLPELVVDSTPGRAHHHEVLAMIDGFDPRRGSKIAGHRGFFLKGMGALLNMALVNYGLHFLSKKGYTPMQTPFFMKKNIMAETCQLSDFDDQLYKISTGKDATAEDPDNEFYLIATSEQPISAYFYNEVVDPAEMPVRFAGFSTCFRKEAGASGKDTWGIFRIHQFEKVEQFVITTPEESWAEHERMIQVSEEFYQSLDLPYRVINIVSGALNDAAAKKYDLEAWFPGYNAYRELVSCSNCTDFQSRGLNVRMLSKKTNKDEKPDKAGKKKEGAEKKDDNEKKEGDEQKEDKVNKDEKADADKAKDKDDKKEKKEEKKTSDFVHMLNGTLCATERTLCCILENYQTDKGVVVPKVLVPYVGTDFIPYTKDMPKKEQ